MRPTLPDLADAKESSCAMVKDHSRPLIVEWPASSRGDLEVRMSRGLVLVRYVGCSMEIVERCATSTGGGYRYVPFTIKEDRLTIRDKGDLWANLPLGAARLEGKLQSRGALDLDMTMVGKFEADGPGPAALDLRGECDRATHVVIGITAGAFELSAGGTVEAGAGVTVLGKGLKGEEVSSRETLSRDGSFSACAKAAPDDKAPPRGCAGALRVEVSPLPTAACPSGSHREGDACVGDKRVVTNVECPAGSDWDGMACVGRVEAPPPSLYGDVMAKAIQVSRVNAPNAADLTMLSKKLASSVIQRAPPPLPCDGTSEADCMTRCGQGSGPSCMELARRGNKDATYWNLMGCMGGSDAGCRGVGRAYETGALGDPDPLAAAIWYRKADVTRAAPSR